MEAMWFHYLRGFIFSNKIYNMGKTKSVRKVAIINPPITTVANGRCTSAPEPLLNAIGKKPRDATNAVIKTGRNLIFVPLNTICFKSISPSFFKRLNSAISTIPFKTATPNNAMKPMPALILNGMPLNAKKKIPPMADKGMAE